MDFLVHYGHNEVFMNVSQEEALYDFLENVSESFKLDEILSYIRVIDSRRINWLAGEVESFINYRNLAFPVGNKRWVSRRAFFGQLPFVISPTRLELVNGILIPGHRCVPFANSNLLPQKYSFSWQGQSIGFTTTEGNPNEFYPYYSIFGEEYAPQYVARDNEENEEAFNNDPYDDPAEVSIRSLDMRNIYREISFVPGDRFLVHTVDWKEGKFKLEKIGADEWAKADLDAWALAAENGFTASFTKLGPGSCTEEQIAYAYWYGDARMRSVPAYALEAFLYEKTDRIDIGSYGIETRFWYAGREIPDHKGLDTGNIRPDKTPIEEIFYRWKLPISEYVIQSYIRDFLYRGEKDVKQILERLVPVSVELDKQDHEFLLDYINSVLEEYREFYSPFADETIGSIRLRAAEIHTAVIDLAMQLQKGEIDISWLPRHTFIILSQILYHTAGVMEDLDSDEAPQEAEIAVIDGSLDSMIETYEDIKELIDEALGSFRRNKLAIVHGGKKSGNVTEQLLQLSIGGIDVWRRVIADEDCTLKILHHIIQTVFGWRNTMDFIFITDRSFQKKEESGSSRHPAVLEWSKENILDVHTSIKELHSRNITELLYEYGTKWTVRIMFLSRNETPSFRPIRCVAGAGAAPPEFINGPVKFKKILQTLENGKEVEQLSAREELGIEFIPGEFDVDICNRNLNANLLIRERS